MADLCRIALTLSFRNEHNITDLQRYTIIVEYFCSQVVFTKTFMSSFEQARVHGARHDENVKIFFFLYLGAGTKWILVILFVPRTNIFHTILPLHTFKYPLHAPAEKSSYFSKYEYRSKVFDYDCATLYNNENWKAYVWRSSANIYLWELKFQGLYSTQDKEIR